MKIEVQATPGMERIGFAKMHTQEEAQALLKRFETEISTAVLKLGNEGIDPAWIFMYLNEVGWAVALGGTSVLAHKHAVESGIVEVQPDPEVAKMGGNIKAALAHAIRFFRHEVTKAGNALALNGLTEREERVLN